MRHRYRHLDPALLQQILQQLGLEELFQKLLLAAGGDAEEAMEWMRRLQEQGYLDGSYDLDEFFASLEEREMLGRDGQGRLTLTSIGERQLRRSAFDEIFTSLRRGSSGYHALRAPGEGVEPLEETRPYEFGDDLHRIDPPPRVLRVISDPENLPVLAVFRPGPPTCPREARAER